MNPECPCCHGEASLMGSLGSLTWYRCRRCGSDFHEEAQTTIPHDCEENAVENFVDGQGTAYECSVCQRML